MTATPHTPAPSVPLRRRATGAAKSVLGAALNAVAPERIVRDRLVILAAHRVDDHYAGDPLTLSVREFDRYCGFLARHFRVVPLREQLRRLRAGAPEAAGTVSITFDDGYACNHEYAAPVLERHGLPATFFIAAGFIGTERVPWWDEQHSPPPRWMSWEQVRDLDRRGFEIGCHSMNHVDFGQVSTAEAREELATSRARLEHELGHRVDLFAYPYGGLHQMSAENLAVVRELGFLCSMSCCGGTNSTSADPYALKRIHLAGYHLTPEEFAFDLARGRV